MTTYENKSGTAALRGIRYTDRLDDDGLPSMQWYGAGVDSLVMTKLITAILDAIGFRGLDKAEQGVIVEMMCQNVGGKVFQRKSVRRIVKSYLSSKET